MSVKQEVEIYLKMRKDPAFFVQMMWGLKPQKKGGPFVKGMHYTWQQAEILEAVKKADNGEASNKISIASGRGIGKSTCMSWLILWHLYCHQNSQIACTAPTFGQIHDVLWKEIKIWIDKMPTLANGKFQWFSDKIAFSESPKTWFAKAATARRENPEALSGIHGDHIMMIADEASAVVDEVFEMAKGIMTSSGAISIMISNPTRLQGVFYDSHHRDKEMFQTLQFSSLESPIVDEQFEKEFRNYGTNSNQYRVNVLGEFPNSDLIDEGGYIGLLDQDMLTFEDMYSFRGGCILGVDVAGEGEDKSVWVVRDNFCARVVSVEATSNPHSVARKTITIMDKYHIPASRVIFDGFGVGSEAVQEMALAGHRVKGLIVGNKPDKDEDAKKYLNIKAKLYWDLYSWIKKGGKLIKDEGWDDLTRVKYRQEMSGKMKIKGKREMRKDGEKSPDYAEALMLTFAATGNEGFKKQTSFGGVTPFIAGTNI